MSNTLSDCTQKTKPDLTAERARKLFDYDPVTGSLLWKSLSMGGRARKSGLAGYLCPRGYLYIRVGQRLYMAHRVVWLHLYGEWPEHGIDHINGRRSDNTAANLRSVPQSENVQNQRKARRDNKSTGLLGVSRPSGRSKYRAQIMAQGRNRDLGYFDTPEEAHAAYLAAKRQMHPGCTI